MRIFGLLIACLVSGKLAFAAEPPKAKIAVIGGTYLNDALLDSDALTDSFTVETKIGESPKIHYGEIDGVPFYYMHRHGGAKYLAGWAALYDLGVEEAIGGATAGAINPVLKTYDFLVVDDFIDFNTTRPRYFPREVTEKEGLVLARYVPSIDPLVHDALYKATLSVIRENNDFQRINVLNKGTVLQAAGGRFETAAEIKAFAGMGGDVVTMNVGTEMSYARQLGINYACLVIVSNPAEGVAPWKFSDLSEIYETLNPVSLEIVKQVVPTLVDLPKEGRVDEALRIHPEMTKHAE